MSDRLIEIQGLSKSFGSVVALSGVSLDVIHGEVHCLLGDNGAGKSTLIKMLSGVYRPTSGDIRFEGRTVLLRSPREAMELGIATVYQDLALIPLMSITRNFFLAREPTRGVFPFRMFDWKRAETIVRNEMKQIGLEVRDPSQPTGILSGGERQSLAIARAVYFGAKLLILDEPTSALGVAQTAAVLRQIRTLRDRGIGIVLITHNVRDAYAIGDRFTVLDHGRSTGTQVRAEATIEALQDKMAGGRSLEASLRPG
jgi:simple sugar transport system ATP-binding protein